VSLLLLGALDRDRAIPLWVVLAILGRTFIQTGLFIVAHDAIHGLVFPIDLRLNHSIGILPILLSSIQLFFFGTYLPHRSSSLAAGVADQVRAETSPEIVSSNYPSIISDKLRVGFVCQAPYMADL
jgi:hypothetical protein